MLKLPTKLIHTLPPGVHLSYALQIAAIISFVAGRTSSNHWRLSTVQRGWSKMQNRFRVGVILFRDGRVLLIKHVNPDTGETWWVPPGGGVQGAESIFDAAKREAKEEANLEIETGKVCYVRQFIYEEFAQNNADFYVTGRIVRGDEHTRNLTGLGGDESFIQELRYFAQDELAGIAVYPSILRDLLWEDLAKGFPETRFIGVQQQGD